MMQLTFEYACFIFAEAQVSIFVPVMVSLASRDKVGFMNVFLEESEYVDFHSDSVRRKAEELFRPCVDDVDKARVAFEFVRDGVSHSFDVRVERVTARASDVLRFGTGICHAKANLLAALLRSQCVPAGFCFQHVTLADDDRRGYCLHGFNAVFLQGRWIRLDARGNRNGVDARFSLGVPVLAFENRPQYDEYAFPGIFAVPDTATMEVLDRAGSLLDVVFGLPDRLSVQPAVTE